MKWSGFLWLTSVRFHDEYHVWLNDTINTVVFVVFNMKTTSECRQPKKQRQRRKLCVYVGSFIPFVAMVTLTYVDSSSLSVTLDRCLRVAGDVERRDTGFYGRWVEVCSGLKQTCTFLKQFQCCQNQQDLKFVFKDEHLNKVTANFC